MNKHARLSLKLLDLFAYYGHKSLIIVYSNWIFWETFNFLGKFKSREVNNKYPLVEQLIISPSEAPIGWTKQVLKYLLEETLNQTFLDWNTRPIIDAELKNWINDDEIPMMWLRLSLTAL